jgi:uncharacterized membrane protein YraQ (UPF0718 family)
MTSMNDAWKNDFYKNWEMKKGNVVDNQVPEKLVMSNSGYNVDTYNQSVIHKPKMIVENYQLDTNKDDYIRALEVENLRLKTYLKQLQNQSNVYEGFTNPASIPVHSNTTNTTMNFDEVLKYILIGVFIMYLLDTFSRRK